MALPTNIQPGDGNHAGLHNDTNTVVNWLRALFNDDGTIKYTANPIATPEELAGLDSRYVQISTGSTGGGTTTPPATTPSGTGFYFNYRKSGTTAAQTFNGITFTTLAGDYDDTNPVTGTSYQALWQEFAFINSGVGKDLVQALPGGSYTAYIGVRTERVDTDLVSIGINNATVASDINIAQAGGGVARKAVTLAYDFTALNGNNTITVYCGSGHVQLAYIILVPQGTANPVA